MLIRVKGFGDMPFEVVAFEPDRRITVAADSARMAVEHTYLLSREADGTRLEQEATMRPQRALQAHGPADGHHGPQRCAPDHARSYSLRRVDFGSGRGARTLDAGRSWPGPRWQRGHPEGLPQGSAWLTGGQRAEFALTAGKRGVIQAITVR